MKNPILKENIPCSHFQCERRAICLINGKALCKRHLKALQEARKHWGDRKMIKLNLKQEEKQ